MSNEPSYLPVRRPVATAMVFTGLAVLGLLAWFRLPVELLPPVEGERLFASFLRPGSEPELVERELVIPLESKINTLPGVKETRAQVRGSGGWLEVTFNRGTDLKVRELEMRRLAAELVRAQPRGSAIEVSASDLSFLSKFVMVVQVAGSDDRHVLREVVERTVAPRLAGVPGVSRVISFGGSPRQITAWVDPDRSAASGVRPEAVVQALAGAAGKFRWAGGVDDESGRAAVVVDGRPAGPAALAAVRVDPARPVQVGHVAEITLGPGKEESRFRVNGRDAVGMAVFKEEGVNLVRLGRSLRERVRALETEYRGQGLAFSIGFDGAEVVEKQIDRLLDLALTGAGIALLVLFFFLRRVRPVLVVGIAVPASLLIALALLSLLGQSINLITLFGLAVAVGMLVDNSIVVFEAAQRLLERGSGPDRAASESVRRTLRAILASTLTNGVVFAPLFFLDLDLELRTFLGILALAIVVPQAASVLVAVGLVPLLSRRLAAPAAQAALAEKRRRRKAFAGISPPDRGRELFGGLIGVALRAPGAWVAGVIVSVLVTVVIAVPWILVNAGGSEVAEAEQFQLRLEVPGGASLDSVTEKFERVEQTALAQAGVLRVETTIEEEGGTITVFLRPKQERPAGVSAGTIREAMTRAAKDSAQMNTRSLGTEDPGGGRGGGGMAGLLGQAPAEIVLSGPDGGRLYELANEIQARLSSIASVGSAWTSSVEGQQELQVLPDTARLASYGLTPDQILPILGAVRREGVVLQTGLNLADGREIPLVVRRLGDDKAGLANLTRLRLETGRGVIPITFLASFHKNPPPPVIERKDGRRQTSVFYLMSSSAPQSGPSRAGLEKEITAAIRKAEIPAGYTMDVGQGGKGTNWFRKALLPILGLLFAVLAVTFESLTLPVVVLLALPLTVIGGAWSLALAGLPAGQMALVGSVALLGVTVNPAILLVDRMQERVRHGRSPGAAALAAVKERTRPVLMTAGTTVAGLWPLALSTGRENEIWPPFATVMIGGILASTLLTLLVIPVGFTVARRLDALFGRLGPWIALAWGLAVGGVLVPLFSFEVVRSLVWQAVTSVLVAGLVLGLIVLLFRRPKPPEPDTSQGPPVLEVRFLHKTYGLPGPIGYAWRVPEIFARRVLERGGKPFDPRDAAGRLIPLGLLGAGAVYLATILQTTFWQLIFVLTAAGLLSFFCRQVRRARGRADALGRVDPGGIENLLAAWLPWVGWFYWTGVKYLFPAVSGEAGLAGFAEHFRFFFFPALVAALIGVVQSGRRTALRLARGEIADYLPQGRLRRMRSGWRRFSRRFFGLDLPSREVLALANVEFRVASGMVGILGPNGAGKTTLLRQLAGILDPSRGRIVLGGLPLARLRRRLAHWVGYLPQDFGLPDDLSAREYLEFYALLYGLAPEGVRRLRVNSLLAEVGLAARADDRIGNYSGGMRQRVAVARTLLRLPAVIIVDEPTVGLDPRERIRFRNLLSRLAAGRIVLFSTHVVEDVAVACERVIVLAGGRVVFDGPVTGLIERARGRVWEVSTAPGEELELPAGARMVEQVPWPGGVFRARVLCEESPHPAAIPAEPTLEDGYLLLAGTRREAA